MLREPPQRRLVRTRSIATPRVHRPRDRHYGGLRWAELVGLRRRHVDLAGARVQVVEQAAEVAGKIIVSAPKTDAGQRG